MSAKKTEVVCENFQSFLQKLGGGGRKEKA